MRPPGKGKMTVRLARDVELLRRCKHGRIQVCRADHQMQVGSGRHVNSTQLHRFGGLPIAQLVG